MGACFGSKNDIDLSPQEIHNLMVKNSKLEDELLNVNNKNNFLQTCCQNLQANNNQLQYYCYQLQLNLQTCMMQITYQQNLQNYYYYQNQANAYKNQINNLINKNNQNNYMNYQNNNRIITLIFNVENTKKFPIITLPEYRLGNILLLLLYKIGNPNINISNLNFYYQSKKITKHFVNNDEVRSLNLYLNNPNIEVMISY